MNKNTGIRITLIGALAAAVSIPLLAQLLRGTNPSTGQTHAPAVAPATRPTAIALAAPAPAPAATVTPVIPPPATAPTVVVAPASKPSAPETAPSAPAPAPQVAIASPNPHQVPATNPVTDSSLEPQPASVRQPATLPTTIPATPAVASAPAPAAPASRPASAAPPAVVHDASGKPVDPDKVVITVGGEKLTAEEVDAFISNLPPDQQAVVRAEGRRGLADYLVNTELLAAEARNRKLDQDPRVQRQMRLIQDQLLAHALVNDVRDNVDDATVRKFFEEHRSALERVHARHILVRAPGSRLPLRPGQKELTEEQAKAKATDIYNRLKAGADFARIAREESDDVGSGAEGGDLGSIRRGTKMEAFEKAVYALKEGEIGQPVRSPMGWHVIQVLERFDSPEKLAEQIRAVLGPPKTHDLLQGLEKGNKVEVDDGFFGPPLPDPALVEPGDAGTTPAPAAPVGAPAPSAGGTPPVRPGPR